MISILDFIQYTILNKSKTVLFDIFQKALFKRIYIKLIKLDKQDLLVDYDYKNEK